MTKRALVVGGMSGLGWEITSKLADDGYEVYATYYSYQMDKSTAHRLQRDFGIIPIKCDVRDLIDLDGLENRFRALGDGNRFIDVIIYSAGTNHNAKLGTLPAQGWSKWKDVIEVTLNGAIAIADMSYNILKDNGVFILLSSVVPYIGVKGTVAYASAKAGYEGLMRTIHEEMGWRGIRTINLALGYFAGGMIREVPTPILDKIKEGIPLKRLGSIKELRNTISFLVSEDAGYISNTTIHMDGGLR